MLGVVALVRRLRRRGGVGVEPAPEAPPADDPADELRRKLAESRPVDEPEAPSEAESTVDERRADVHAEGRAALDEMRSSTDD